MKPYLRGKGNITERRKQYTASNSKGWHVGTIRAAENKKWRQLWSVVHQLFLCLKILKPIIKNFGISSISRVMERSSKLPGWIINSDYIRVKWSVSPWLSSKTSGESLILLWNWQQISFCRLRYLLSKVFYLKLTPKLWSVSTFNLSSKRSSDSAVQACKERY